jgi:peptide/nickel transport system substrate-binding protein
VLTVSIEDEPDYLAALAPLTGSGATDFWQRSFNALLDLYDGNDQPQPYLAEALPVLNTDTWQVFPDGTMETRYRLKPNLVWHDGTPLTAHDFVFTFENAKPSLGFRTGILPFTHMASVTAADDRSLLIRWRTTYPDANVLLQGGSRFGLVPFPRHILEPLFVGASPQTVQESQYWSRDFVGAGPFKLSRWENGSLIEGTAFDRHALGRPKIDRIRFVFIKEQSTALANILAETTHVALNSLRFEHFLQVKQAWASNGKGTAGLSTVSLSTAQLQHRPDYANPRAMLDVRVRRALAYAVDRKTLSETVWAGELAVWDTIFDTRASYYPTVERAIVKYPYDLAASERLMNEAGYRKGPDGIYVGPEGKPTFVLQAASNRPEMPVLDANWREAGFDVQQQRLLPSDANDAQARASFPAVYITASGAFEVQQTAKYRTSEISSAATRWRGENQSGWSNAEFDRLVEALGVTLDPNERNQQRAQMARLLTEELPSLTLTPNPNIFAYLNTVKNVGNSTTYSTGRITWNVEQWEIAG